MKTITTIKMLAVCAGMLLSSNAMAGDGTKANPYTVGELNAQKEALAASGNTVWVKADLKGLGEDGTKTDNADTEDGNGKTVRHMAALFGDATDTFVAYSYQILSDLNMSDLTNTKDLLLSVNYGTTGHPHGNSTYPQYATDYEKDVVSGNHFSIGELHGALKVEIKNGMRGFHFPASYLLPKEMVASRVNSNYTKAKGASINYGEYDGAEKDYVINKSTALVLLAYDGSYDFVLSADYYEQINSNGLKGGTQAGTNVGTAKNKDERWWFRFVCNGSQTGFERNSDDNSTVILDSKDEIYLEVNNNDTHFGGNYAWETADKKWITWAGKKIEDFENHSAGTVMVGDANGDGTVDVSDVVAIVNKILEKPSANFNEKAADVNGDGNIDVGDVVAVVNIILKN